MNKYEKLQKALKHLERRNAEYKNMDEQPQWIRESIIESVIQRFEVCCDCLWKALKAYLEENLKGSKIPNSPKAIFELAYEKNILSVPKEQWHKYIDMRDATSHDYSASQGSKAIDIIADLSCNSIELYQTFTGKTWD